MEPMIPSYDGKTIAIIRLDGSVQLWTSDNWYIHCEAHPWVTVPGTSPVQIDPGDSPDLDADEDYPPVPDALTPFIGKTIRALCVSDGGDLDVSFDDDCRLSVKSSEFHEAWQLSGPRGEMVVCMPGGKLATWGPRDD